MQKFVLLCLLFISSLNITHAKELPDFTGLVEEYGEAVVNISTVQTQQIAGGQVFQKFLIFRKILLFSNFFADICSPFQAQENMNPSRLAQDSLLAKTAIF